jgi:uncharacterized protein (TIGR03089 family)
VDRLRTVASLETPTKLLAAALRDEPGRPLYTFYDDATGERIELSVKTFENWVAKTANLLQDGLGVDAGERIAIMLPSHWQGAVWMVAAWSAGLIVDLDATADAAVIVTGPDTIEAACAVGAHEVVALSLRPLGGAFTEPLPDGVVDYGAEVLTFGDVFSPLGSTDPEQPLLGRGDDLLDGMQLVSSALERATALGLGEGARVLTGANPVGPKGYLDALLAPLARNGSIVLVRNPDPDLVDQHARDEKATHTFLT